MFFTLSTPLISLCFMSLLLMTAACLATGFIAANKPARHPVAIADVLGRSGRVHLGLLAAGVLGLLIALVAEHGLPAEKHSEENDSE